MDWDRLPHLCIISVYNESVTKFGKWLDAEHLLRQIYLNWKDKHFLIIDLFQNLNFSMKPEGIETPREKSNGNSFQFTVELQIPKNDHLRINQSLHKLALDLLGTDFYGEIQYGCQ